LSQKKEKTLDELEIWRGMQETMPFTLSKAQLIAYTDEYMKQAKSLRATNKGPFTNIYTSTADFTAVKASLAKFGMIYVCLTLAILICIIIGLSVSTLQDLAALTTPLKPADNYEGELQIMAETLAYFRISARRQFDVVPMLIQRHLFRSLTKNFCTEMCHAILGTDDDQIQQKAARFMAEDPQLSDKRKSLNEEQVILVEAVKILNQFADS
jgi:hypothetical protein